MTKKLVWRLGKLPSVQELTQLIDQKIISKEEAREVLFSTKEDWERDKESLESEIKFLRELVEKLSKDRKTIVETIKIIETPYKIYPWYQPYNNWTYYGTTTSPIPNTVYCSQTTSGTTHGATSLLGGWWSQHYTWSSLSMQRAISKLSNWWSYDAWFSSIQTF